MSDADQTPEPAPDASPDLPPSESPDPASYEPAPVVEEQRSSRLPLVLATVGAVLVLGAALAAPLVDRALRGEEQVQRALDLTLVETWDITDRAHTTDDVTYPQDPPAGGAHAPIWLDCGVYDVPVRDENAVHDLEHGTVWITHDPGLSANDVEALATSCPTTGSCRRARVFLHRSSSPSGVRSSSSTARTTNGSGCSWRSTATGTPRRSSG